MSGWERGPRPVNPQRSYPDLPFQPSSRARTPSALAFSQASASPASRASRSMRCAAPPAFRDDRSSPPTRRSTHPVPRSASRARCGLDRRAPSAATSIPSATGTRCTRRRSHAESTRCSSSPSSVRRVSSRRTLSHPPTPTASCSCSRRPHANSPRRRAQLRSPAARSMSPRRTSPSASPCSAVCSTGTAVRGRGRSRPITRARMRSASGSGATRPVSRTSSSS